MSAERKNVSSGSPYEEVFGYCRVVRVGDTIHVAGTCAAMDCLDGTDAHEQANSALGIISDALADVGATAEDVVRTVTYVTNIDDMELVARAHRAVFGEIRPVATLVEVSRLADPRMVVEIEAYAQLS